MNETADIVAPVATPIPIAAPETPPAPEVESLADHAAAFGPDKDDPRPRHRARSQQARVEDVPQIADLTKELRALEGELGIAQKPGESARVYGLRRQLEIAKLAKSGRPAPAPPEPAKPAARAVPSPVAPSAPGAFSDKEPTLAEFESESDPYAAYMRAVGRYDRRKDAFEERQQTAARDAETQAAADKADGEARWQQTLTAHRTRLDTFAATHPTFLDTFSKAVTYELAPLLQAALIHDDNGPALMYALGQHPALLDEMHVISEGKPLTDANVAAVQRLLKSRTQAAGTGSAAAPVLSRPSVPRPPNPVRTGPQTPSDEPPGDDASLAEHARFYGPSRRR